MRDLVPPASRASIPAVIALLLAVSIVAGVLPGCFRERRTVTQVDARSDVRFSGNTGDAEFRIERDGAELFPWTDVDDDELYRLDPGPVDIIVRRDDEIIVRRRILLAGGQVFEVAVP